jgi:hypothetical protein
MEKLLPATGLPGTVKKKWLRTPADTEKLILVSAGSPEAEAVS